MSITGPINRHFKVLLGLALALAAAAVLVATQISVHSAAAGTGGQAATVANQQGHATATPPILPATGSSGQAADGGAFSSSPPAHGRYSSAEMNAYTTTR